MSDDEAVVVVVDDDDPERLAMSTKRLAWSCIYATKAAFGGQ